MRKTRIICTLSPASRTTREMIAAGADVFRLNMSHAKHDWVRANVPRVRAQVLGYGIVIMLESMIEHQLPPRESDQCPERCIRTGRRHQADRRNDERPLTGEMQRILDRVALRIERSGGGSYGKDALLGNLAVLSDVRAGQELVDCVQLRPVH